MGYNRPVSSDDRSLAITLDSIRNIHEQVIGHTE